MVRRTNSGPANTRRQATAAAAAAKINKASRTQANKENARGNTPQTQQKRGGGRPTSAIPLATRNGTGPANTSSGGVQLKGPPLAEKDAPSARPRADVPPEPTHLIPKPKGCAGTDWSLQTEMKLDNYDDFYKAVRRTVRHLVDHGGLKKKTPFRQHPPKTLGRVYDACRARQPYLRWFENDWATAEFIKQLMKNRRSYSRRIGQFDDDDNDDNDNVGDGGEDNNSDAAGDGGSEDE